VWVEHIVIILRLTGATRALLAISNVRALVQDEHGVAEKLPPRLFFLIPPLLLDPDSGDGDGNGDGGGGFHFAAYTTAATIMLSARSFSLYALFDHRIIINNTGVASGRSSSSSLLLLLLLIQSRIGAARAGRARSSSGGGVEAPALEVVRERGRLEDSARQVRQHVGGERALGAGANVVEALDDERRLGGDGALEVGGEPVVVARVGEARTHGGTLGGIGLVHGGGVPVLDGAVLRLLDAGVPVVALEERVAVVGALGHLHRVLVVVVVVVVGFGQHSICVRVSVCVSVY
jgi:hypothetical protein